MEAVVGYPGQYFSRLVERCVDSGMKKKVDFDLRHCSDPCSRASFSGSCRYEGKTGGNGIGEESAMLLRKGWGSSFRSSEIEESAIIVIKKVRNQKKLAVRI